MNYNLPMKVKLPLSQQGQIFSTLGIMHYLLSKLDTTRHDGMMSQIEP